MKNILFVFILLLPFLINAQNKKNHLRNGNDLYEDSLYNEAEIEYRKSLEKDQGYFAASYNLADAIYKQGRFTKRTHPVTPLCLPLTVLSAHHGLSPN